MKLHNCIVNVDKLYALENFKFKHIVCTVGGEVYKVNSYKSFDLDVEYYEFIIDGLNLIEIIEDYRNDNVGSSEIADKFYNGEYFNLKPTRLLEI